MDKFQETLLYSKNQKVLYVEDDESTRFIVVKLLKTIFSDVTDASNGLDGYKIYEKNLQKTGRTFDIVISDIEMPYLNGIEMARKIKKIKPNQVIALLSSHSESEHLIDAINIGITKFIKKPINNINSFTSEINNLSEKVQLLNILQKSEYLLQKQHAELDNKKNIPQQKNLNKILNKDNLINDLSLLEDEAMLIILKITQIHSIKKEYGVEAVKNISQKKVAYLDEIINKNEATLYKFNIEKFAILITKKNLFDKYLSLLEYSILNTNDDDEIKGYNLADFTAGISYGINDLLSNADSTLEEAISENRSYKICTKDEKALSKNTATLENLEVYKRALHNGDITPYFQPIIDNITGKVFKYEALARIKTEDGKIVSPAYFLNSAKKDKSFEFFTKQMMQKSFIIYEKSKAHISINLTFENINSPSMVDYIKNRLDKYGGDGITFEILESEEINNYDVIDKFIAMVKSYGCEISIDDFGSGYSNFTHIIKLDIDYIKLDGSLVQKLNTNEHVKNMITGILSFTKSAKIRTIAEYVNSKALANTVKEMGIDYSQGYFYGQPQDADFYKLI